MNDEIAAYAASIRSRFEQMRACVHEVPSERLNDVPIPGGNSVYALVEHTIGNARAWILGIALGEERGRDRPAEFASRGHDVAKLLSHIDGVMADVDVALARLSPERLGKRMTPAPDLWGEGVPREISVRDTILQVIEHASLHLGHLQLTRDALR